MQTVFSYPSGQTVVAVVLSVGTDYMRVIAPECKDGLDLYLRDQEWVTETGVAIRVDAILFENEVCLPSTVSPRRGQCPQEITRRAGAFGL